MERKTMDGYIDFAITVQGASHIRKKKTCQDYSASCCNERFAIIAVADGHGDDRYFRSALGSQFAVEAAIESIREFIDCEESDRFSSKPEKTQNEVLKQLEKSIIAGWNKKVKEHISTNPFLEEEPIPLSENRRENYRNGRFTETIYGTTLLVAVVTDRYSFGMQIGDGDSTIGFDDGTYDTIPKDESLIANITTSLCQENAIEKFHEKVFIDKKPVFIAISTDGVLNSFKTEDHYRNFIKRVVNTFTVDDFETTKGFLEEYMHKITRDGSGDDLSVAGIIDKHTLGMINNKNKNCGVSCGFAGRSVAINHQ